MSIRGVWVAIVLWGLLIVVSCVEKPQEPMREQGETNAKAEYHAPMISSLDDYAASVGAQNGFVENINFGETKEGVLPTGAPFKAYMFDALPKARITISVMALDDTLDPVVVLYGPRTRQGLWGEPIATGDDIDGSTDAVISGYELDSGGWYLILVASYDNQSGGRFGIGLGCQGVCEEPACPDEICTLYCESGFLLDPNGCTVCSCAETATDCECQTDADCPPGSLCDGCSCESINACDCPDVYDPVCGTDGQTYPNRCQAECAGVEVAHKGECEGFTYGCRSDADCPDDQKCVDGICMPEGQTPGCGCSDIWDPVCGTDGQTYPNQCMAECAGVEVAHPGTCEEEQYCQPVCISVADPSSGNTPTDESPTGWFDPCTGEFIKSADCKKCWEDEQGEEICIQCEAVCGGIGTSAEGWYDSCTGYIIVSARCASSNSCRCPPVYAPVCGVDGITYLNLCEIKCAGVPIARVGECTDARDWGCQSNEDCPFGYICVDFDPNRWNNDSNEPPKDNEEPGARPRHFCIPGEALECETDDDCPEGFFCAGAEEAANVRHCLPEVHECIRTGCHLEVCAPFEVSTNCDNWRPEFVCLDQARCERLEDSGMCGWVATQEYYDCLESITLDGTCNSDSDCPENSSCINGECVWSECVCPEVGPPVCGTDCRTYKNICELNCAGVDLLHIGECRPGDGCSK